MNRVWLAAVVWAAALCQAYFFSALSGSSIVPNLVMVVLLYVCLEGGLRQAVGMAVWGGFWLDVASMSQFGLHMILQLAFVAGIFGLRRLGLDFKRRLNLSLVIMAGVLLYNLALLVGAWIDTRHLSWSSQLPTIWLLDAVITVMFAWLASKRLIYIMKPLRRRWL